MKRCKSLISMCALAAMANCAKADIVSAQEQLDGSGNLKSIVLHDPTATIGSIKTPWIFSRPNGRSGFANDFTTNAISVVSEDGVHYYAQTGDSGTNVIHFTLNQDGIPNKDGNIIHVPVDNLAERKLVGVTQGYLCFYPTNQYGTAVIYNPERNDWVSDSSIKLDNNSVPAQFRCLAVHQDLNGVYVLCNCKYTTQDGQTKKKTMLKGIINGVIMKVKDSDDNQLEVLSDEKKWVMGYYSSENFFIGDSDGNIMQNKTKLSPKLPGPISSITMFEGTEGIQDVFVTSTATNAFLNLGWPFEPLYNKVLDSNDISNPKPMVPKTKDGLIRIIDNRPKGGKLMCVTKKGIHTFDD